MANDDNARISFMFFRQKMGLSRNQAAGIAGNFSQESGFNPEAINPRSGAYGIAQWLDTRKDNLMAATGDGGDLRAQLEYFKNEVENDPYERSQFEKFLNYDDTSIEGYTYAFRKYCERPADFEAMDTNRVNEAYRISDMVADDDDSYGDGGGVSSEPAYSSETLDWSNLIHNHEAEDSPYNYSKELGKLTDTDNLRPEAKYGLNVLGAYMRNMYDSPLTVTAGAETWTHKGGTYSHHAGWKADVYADEIRAGTQGAEDFRRFCNEHGWSATWETEGGEHWDIDFSGNDRRDGNNPVRPSGNFFALTGAGSALAKRANNELDPNGSYTDALGEYYRRLSEEETKPSFWNVLSDNFLDSMFSTGSARLLESLWGNFMHSNNHLWKMDDLTQDDIDFVKSALPNDKAAQNFILLNGRDSEEIRWLTQRKQEEKKRKQNIEQWKSANQNALARALMATSGALGYVADPINLIPIGTYANSLKVLGRLAEGATNINKIQTIAKMATITGIQTGAITVADDVLREKFGGEKPDYGMDAAVGFLGGAVLASVGGLWKGLKKGGVTADITRAADLAETRAIEHAMNVDTTKASSETIESALKLHDPTFREKVNSKAYETLESNQRVIATTYEKARKLIEEASGKKIPDTAKALYVPNEDYTFILTDKVQPKEVDKLLSHEFGVHAGLRKAIGDRAYDSLMTYVSRQAEKEGTAFFEARAKAGSYDPEEIFAQMVEDGTLPDSTWSRVKGSFNKMLNKEGYKTNFTLKDVKEILAQQVNEKRNPEVFHVNPDGSTAFAGLQYSQNNILNPVTLANVYQLESDIRKVTQADLGTGKLTAPLRWVAQHLEQGIFGEGINSMSNTFRKYAPLIWDDPQGRGLGNVQTISAETNKLRLKQLLIRPFGGYTDARQRWVIANKHIPSKASNAAFDMMFINAYNAKYANNVANVLQNVPAEVTEAVESMHNLLDLMLNLGKRSADDVGATADNMVDKDWYPVDGEWYRQIDGDRLRKFLIENFIDTPQQTAVAQARDFLDKYYRTFVKRDVVEAKIIRDKKMENIKIQAANAAMQARVPANSKWKPKALIPEVATPQEVDKWIDDAVPNAVHFILNGVYDPADMRNLSNLGNLSFFKVRVPIDTTGILKLPNGNEFSFDNNIRSYDVDAIIQKVINRFAGEASLMNVFGSQKALDAFFDKVEKELGKAISDKNANQSVGNEIRDLKRAIAEFRGVRPEDETAIGKVGALCHILRNFAYAKNGANMLFNQFAEVGGAMAYGGVSQMFSIFPPLARFVDDIKYGKQTTQLLRDRENQMFGATMESKIWSANFDDRVVHDALTDQHDLASKALIKVADITANLGKVTSSLNMLPKLTDFMIRRMRIETMMDSLRIATQGKTPLLRNPFSEKKLRAAHVSEKDWQDIQARIRQYTTMDANGKFTGFDIDAWQIDDMNTFLKWYNLIQLQAERAIVPVNRQGNKNLFKSRNSLTQLLFQFKDYTLRAINSQTMRAMKARDLDDAFATMASIVTNTAAYAVRVGAIYAAYKAAGLDKKAEEYKDYMFKKGNLERAVAFRSTILGSPLSFVNDWYEIATGAPTIRTTVERDAKNYKNTKERTMSDIGGDFISQIPALSAGIEPLIQVYHAFSHATNDKTTQKDFKNALKLLPIPNFIPLTALQQYLVEQSGYPEKKR